MRFYTYYTTSALRNDTLNVQIEDDDGIPFDVSAVEVRGNKARHPRGGSWIDIEQAIELMKANLKQRNQITA